MYNLRARARAIPAGAARPHLGMRARALPTVASQAASTQVTPTQALEILDDVDIVPETEMIVNDSYGEINAAESAVDSVEAAQPPTPSPFAPTLSQTNKWDFTIIA